MNTNPLMLSGVMTYGYDDKGRETADFQNCDPGVLVKPFVGQCKVQRVRDGNLYVTRLPKRIRNKPMFRQDHSSVSRSRNRKYYFVMIMDEADVQEMPDTLVSEAREAAEKLRTYLSKD
jgi:hypothetical protein